ncbi:uncharacterized protein [Pocillopora verrucosa]|uniref:uncharacterized protein isoform X2 n=1 Tax=Pocillopora verrucosa TaxID=203993 RepID=UPI002797082B|nr:uncharacterized protein LOC131786817 isoform X2 [Pocillopora verrucosa]XP_058961485.1 uncharacterized protein LOC131788416 isoform X2 [Pocillopora verrucosa]
MHSCPYCTSFLGRSFKKLLHHIKFIHSHEPNFSITCRQCGQSFRKFNSFKSHIQREEKKNALLNFANVSEQGDEDVEDENSDEEDGEDNDSNEDTNYVDDVTRFLALFILKTKEENQLSQQTINAILDNTGDLVDSSLVEMKNKVVACLQSSGIEIADVEGLSGVLDEPSIYSQAKQRLQNEYQQMKYFVENFNFVEPQEVILNQYAEYRYLQGKQKLCLVKETFHYISILKTLQSLLNQADVLCEVMNGHSSNDGILRDYCDSEQYKMHALFGQPGNALLLHCYYDDFQVTNPLGSKTKKHKIGAFYFNLGNLSPEYRSVINSIQLIALCRVPLIKKYGMNRILQPFMQDLHQLEADRGVTFWIDEQERTFSGSIGPYSSDNLGAHSLGGFQESFSGLRICRICMATREDTNTKFTEADFQIRTRAIHDRHCRLVENDANLEATYGVKTRSVLNQSRYFHITDGLVLDVMHDQLEGVLPLEVKILLQKYIQEENYFTLEIVNDRLERLWYPQSDASNKPSPIKPQSLANNSMRISQSARMWCLARMFPILIGDLIPQNDEHWENFLRLLKIEEIVFAPKATPQLAAYLGVLIEEYLEDYVNLNDRLPIPKQHYMVHYPNQIIKNGPLVRNWAMRFEAKHNYFKKLVDNINNFKNITYSLAMRHQALQTYRMQSSQGNYLRVSLEIGPAVGRVTTVQEAGVEDELQEADPQTKGDSSLTRTSWVKVYGTKYVKGDVIVIDYHHGFPILGKIQKVLVVERHIVWFQYLKINVTEFVCHLNAFKVQQLNEIRYIKQSELLDYYPLGLVKGFGCYANQVFVTLKYRLDLMQ